MLDVRSFHESFYGTPKPAETGRRGKKRQAKAKEEPENEIAVVGIHYRSFDDDSMAAFVNSPAAQVPWNGDKTLLIDRYDVRHLLQDLSGIRRRRRAPSPNLDVSKEELDYERYRDLEGLENPSPAPEGRSLILSSFFLLRPTMTRMRTILEVCTRELVLITAAGGSSRLKEKLGIGVPKKLLSSHLSLYQSTYFRNLFAAEDWTSLWCPYEGSLLEADVHGNVQPSSLKVHQIMAGTAKFVIEHGGQAEIVLRVKQASNPTFGFLMPDHYHHEYFRFLVDNPQHVGVGLIEESVAAVQVLSEEAEGGLSLLGTAYGDSDEEDEADAANGAKRNHRDVEHGGSLEKGDDVSEDRSHGSDNGSHGIKSPTSDHRTAVGLENGACDSGSPVDPATVVEVSGNESHGCVGGEAGEISKSGNGGTVAGMPEPLPPGTETPDAMEVDNEESSVPPEYLEQDLPPYKEPPVQLRRIIDKMVEFISRNGKEFEAIVRERDKKDGRFQFLLPWNELYPYFSRSLEVAQQANALSDPSASDVPPSDESKVPVSRDHSEDQSVNGHFLKGVPYWDESSMPDTSARQEEAGLQEIDDIQPGLSDNGIGGMGFDAVMAAVRAATRGLSRGTEDNELASSQPISPEGVEPPVLGSDDAVIAAIRAATGGSRRSKMEDRTAGGKGELVQSRGSTSLSGAADQTSLPVAEGVQAEEKNSSGLGAPVSDSEVTRRSQGDDVVAGKVVAKAAALAAGQEGDSADALLSPAGKLKAERLKRAKLFAAMLREGNGAIVRIGHGSGSHGISATPSVDKCSQAGISVDVKPKAAVSEKVLDVPEATKSAGDHCEEGILPTREHTSGALPVYVDAEDDTQHASESGKQKKPKAKSKEADEKHRKHHRKRKSHHDGEERRKEGGDDADTEQRRDRRHDHDYEEKRKDRKRDNDAQLKTRGRNGHITKEMVDEDRYLYELGETRETKESRKERRYRHDADSNRASRHAYDYEEIRYEDRHGHDLDGKDRSSRHRRRHGSEEKGLESRHQNNEEKRKDSERDHDSEEKRKERRLGQGSEERTEHRHVSDDRRRDRRHSHGKRKKHREDDDFHVNEDKDDGDEKHTHRKSRRHQRESERESTFRSSGKPSSNGGETTDDRIHRDTGSGEQHEVIDQTQKDRSTVSTMNEPASTSVDVPDDIRAKVRAMLARI